ncbi:MAG: hypothetical protein N2560_09405 [Ignavibacteria bacterium]|nr:hypothetical protein [Ignavibacteria bacterium]
MITGDELKGSEFSRKQNFPFIWLILAFLFFSILIFFSVFWSSNKTIKRFELSGFKYFDSKPIESLLSSNLYRNININELKSSLEKFDFVDKCKIYKKDSETLVVEILEKEPLLLFSSSSGVQRIISERLEFIPFANIKSIDVPIFSLETIDEAIIRQEYFDVLNFVKGLRKFYPSVYMNIDEVNCDKSTICLYTKSTRTKVLFNRNMSLEKVELFEEVFSRKDWMKFFEREIDFRFDGLVVIR